MIQKPILPDRAPPFPEQAPEREDRGEARRQFLAKCGRFAAVTAPTVTLLLDVSSIPRKAHALSGIEYKDKEYKQPKFDKQDNADEQDNKNNKKKAERRRTG